MLQAQRSQPKKTFRCVADGNKALQAVFVAAGTAIGYGHSPEKVADVPKIVLIAMLDGHNHSTEVLSASTLTRLSGCSTFAPGGAGAGYAISKDDALELCAWAQEQLRCAPESVGLPPDQEMETQLPQSVVDMAKRYRLQIEEGEILYSEDQGESQYATLCVNRWLTARSGEIRLEVRIIQRETYSDDDWLPCGESIQSDPFSEAQALQLVNHWGRCSQAAVQLAQQNERQERDRFDAWGPRPQQPWEVEPIEDTERRIQMERA